MYLFLYLLLFEVLCTFSFIPMKVYLWLGRSDCTCQGVDGEQQHVEDGRIQASIAEDHLLGALGDTMEKDGFSRCCWHVKSLKLPKAYNHFALNQCRKLPP